jgi:hypothetical protein
MIPVIFTVCWAVYSKGFRSPSMAYPQNNSFFTKILAILPTESERKLGFVNTLQSEIATGIIQSRDVVPHGSIIVSESFNVQYVMNPSWNPNINIDKSGAIYSNILNNLRNKADLYSKIIQHKSWKSLRSRLPLINEGKIGILSNIITDIEAVKIYETDYFVGLLTGNMAVNDIQEYRGGVPITKSVATDRLLFNKRDDQYVLSDFDDLGKCCSHHLGVDVLAITRDFYLPLMIQGLHTEVSQGLLAPTGSGSADWSDQDKVCTFKDLLKVAGGRELREEATKQTGDPTKWIIKNIAPIGYFRMPHRAGKPQFALLAKLDNYRDDMGPNREVTQATNVDSHTTVFRAGTLRELRDLVTELIKNGHNQYPFSVPLWGALVCLHHAISHKPDYVKGILGYPD